MDWIRYIGDIIVSPVLENYCAEIASKCQQTIRILGIFRLSVITDHHFINEGGGER